MTRALSSSWRCLATFLSALVFVALTSKLAFAGKPTVAILGLEVVDPSGNIDQTSTQVAKDLTEGLRNRAKAGAGPYQLVAGGDKELIDEKLIHNCDNEAIPCMADIGRNLGAEYLVYGRIEKRGAGYVVTINLLNVTKKKFEKAKTPLMITQSDAASLAASARKAYNDLTGVSELGTLVVTANADRGTVLLDDEPRGTLASGSATITGLKENRYRLVIEADGYSRSQEVVVTIRSGETTTQPVTLVSATGDPLKHEITGTTSTSKTNIWKPVFFVSLAAGATLGGVSLYAFTKWRGDKGDVTLPVGHPGFSPSNCDGGSLSSDFDTTNVGGDPGAVCKNRNLNIKTGIAAGVVGLVVLGTGYMAFFRGSSERPTPPATTVGRRKRKDTRFSVTPILSPEGGGATVQIDW